MIEIPPVLLVFSQNPVIVEVEETVTTCAPPGNGAGPFWCYGAPLLVRLGKDVFVSAMETGEDIPPLCNTRWRLFRKQDDGEWEIIQASEKFNEREPCPLVCFPNGQLFLSVNPSTRPPGTKYGPCEPHLLELSAIEPTMPGIPIHPRWDEGTVFTDHSYRGISADEREILLLNIHAQTGEQFWSFSDTGGKWIRHSHIRFPIRSCYPEVALKNRSAHVLAIGDIVEPNEEWRRYKFEKTASGWDYVFRRLFYTWTPDITKHDFAEPIEVDNVDATAGYIANLDLWIDADGSAHLLYRKQTVQSALMRDRFFPGIPITISLEHVIIQDGSIIKHTALLKGGEDASSEIPGNARFHVTGNDRLFLVYYCSGKDADGNILNENRLLQILPGKANKPVRLGLREPFGTFFTATERGGSKPSDIIDLFGSGRDNTLRYARIRIL